MRSRRFHRSRNSSETCVSQRRSSEEPEAVHLSWRGAARDPGCRLQRHGKKTPSQQAAAQGMNHRSRLFRTTQTTMSRTSRTSLPPSNKGRLSRTGATGDPALATATPAQQAAAAAYGPTGQTDSLHSRSAVRPAKHLRPADRPAADFPAAASRLSNWQPKSENWRTTRDLHRILYIPHRRRPARNPTTAVQQSSGRLWQHPQAHTRGASTQTGSSLVAPLVCR